MENYYCIYQHIGPTGKCYIGQTNNYRRRAIEHKSHSIRHRKCPYFYNAIRKYGFDNFIHEVLYEGLTMDEANALEEWEITQRNTRHPNGYNLMNGGLNRTHSAESKVKISISNKGRKDTDAARARKSAARKGKPSPNKGRIVSDETKRLLSANSYRKGKPAWNTGVKAWNKGVIGVYGGWKHTEDAKAKISLATSKPVSIYGVVYQSIEKASISLGKHRDTIHRWLIKSQPKYSKCFYLKPDIE